MFGLGHKKGHYKNPTAFIYFSWRYNKHVSVEEGFLSDGATGAIDVCPMAWFTHDKLCETGEFDDGTLCDNWQASHIISDILNDECDRQVRRYTWFWATWFAGGGKCRENGLW